MASSHWLIIPAPSFIESDTLKGFLLAHPSFFNSIDFSPIISGPCILKKKRCCQLFILPRSLPLHSLSLLFLSKLFQSWQNCNCKHASSAQQLSKGAEWERNWSAGSRYSKQSLPVPCVLSNYEVQEVAGFAWAIKRLKNSWSQKGAGRDTYN